MTLSLFVLVRDLASPRAVVTSTHRASTTGRSGGWRGSRRSGQAASSSRGLRARDGHAAGTQRTGSTGKPSLRAATRGSVHARRGASRSPYGDDLCPNRKVWNVEVRGRGRSHRGRRYGARRGGPRRDGWDLGRLATGSPPSGRRGVRVVRRPAKAPAPKVLASPSRAAPGPARTRSAPSSTVAGGVGRVGAGC